MDLQTAYQQPQGMGPDGMSGFQSGLELMAKRAAQEEQMRQMAIQTQQEQANLTRFTGQTPGMVQQTQLQGAQAEAQNTPQMLEQFARGKQGEWQTQQATGQHDVATVGGKIDKTNSGNLVSSLENTARSLELASQNGMLSAQEPYDAWRKGISPTMQAHFPANYTPDVPDKIRAISDWLVNSPEHKRQQENTDQTNSWGFIREQSLANTNNAAAQARADTAATAHVTAAQGRKPEETRDKAIARLNGELRKDPKNEGARRELAYYLNKDFVDDFAKDARQMMLATQASSNPAMAREHESYQSWSRAKYFDQHGIDNEPGQLSFEEYKWAQRAMEINHGITLEQVLSEGRKKGKIKSRKRP